jgi:transcriptional regulator with XRE-family HTH domain
MAGGMAAGGSSGLAARIRRLREARGMTRGELVAAMQALGARTERNDIIHYEVGAYWPRVPTFAALARVLGVSMETLFYGEEDSARIAEERERAGCGGRGRPRK